MDLTDPEIKALASVLAARLGTDLAPIDPSDAPARGDTPADRWERKLRHADAKGHVARVVQIAARALPDDPVLAEANSLVTAVPPDGPGLPAVVGATAAALLVSTFGGMMTAVALASSSPAVTTPEPLVVPTAADAPAEPSAAPLESVVRPTASAQLDVRPTSSASLSTARPCDAGGWVYAGADRPAGTFVAPTGLFVRSAPLGVKVGCALREGAAVAVDDARVAATGGRYWLHVTPSDLPHPDALVRL